MNVPKDKLMRWITQGALALLLIVGALAVTLFMKVGDLESANAEAQKGNQVSAVALKGVQDGLAAAKAKLADLEKRQLEADNLKALLVRVEPQVTTALEAAGKSGKPDVRAAALTGLGVIGQITRGANNEAALAVLDRALALDKNSCVAGLATNLGGAKKVEVAAECQSLLPATATAAAPAAGAKPAAPAPAPEAAKAAPATDKK